MSEELTHTHRCMRCHEEFECRTPGICAAGYDVLPTIVEPDGYGGVKMSDHCPPPLTYKGYTGRAERDSDAGVWHGEVTGIRDVITFEADAVDGVEPAFRASVDDYLAMCADSGDTPTPARSEAAGGEEVAAVDDWERLARQPWTAASPLPGALIAACVTIRALEKQLAAAREDAAERLEIAYKEGWEDGRDTGIRAASDHPNDSGWKNVTAVEEWLHSLTKRSIDDLMRAVDRMGGYRNVPPEWHAAQSEPPAPRRGERRREGAMEYEALMALAKRRYDALVAADAQAGREGEGGRDA